jgi:hypothetical protein
MSTVNQDIKSDAHRLIDQLPPGATWADLLYLIYAKQQIDEGIRDADNGEMVSTEELRRSLGLSP